MGKHIIWDWNGTLFNDITAVVAATNEIFAGYRLDPLTADGFRAVHSRPIWAAYERLLGRPLADGEWERLDRDFHDRYHQRMLECGLADDAHSSLQSFRDAGGTQSLLSMWMHERLVPAVRRYGIAEYFSRVDGTSTLAGGGHKAEHMATHLESLRLDPRTVLVVGDSIDDAAAAVHVGARAVLYTGGTTSRADLLASGFPVVDTLTEALDHA